MQALDELKLKDLSNDKDDVEKANFLADVPAHTLLRCAITEHAREQGHGPTKEGLFSALQKRYEWLRSEKGGDYQVRQVLFLRLAILYAY